MKASVRCRLGGGVLLVVLMFVVVSGAITAGWIATTTAEAAYVDTLALGGQRRVDYWSCDALVREYLWRQVSTSAGAPALTVDNFPGTGDSVAVAAVGLAPLMAPDVVPEVNHFNPGNGERYGIQVGATFTRDELDPHVTTWLSRYRLQSAPLVLTGDLLIANTPTSTATIESGVVVEGRSILWSPQAPNSYALTTQAYTTPTVTPPSPSATFAGLQVGNLPFVPLISAEGVGATPIFSGQLNVIDNASGRNSLDAIARSEPMRPPVEMTGTTKSVEYDDPLWDDPESPSYPGSLGYERYHGISAEGDGVVSVIIGKPQMTSNLILGNGVTTLNLIGQGTGSEVAAADAAIALIVIVNQDLPGAGELQTVNLLNENQRKVTFGIKKVTGGVEPSVLALNKTGGAAWRSVFVLENAPIEWSAGGLVAVEGGIQSDRSILIAAGGLALTPEIEPRLMELQVPRDLWVEGYAQ